MKVIDIIHKLSTARLEYQTASGSVLNKFVVPFFIDRFDLRKISHSIALAGSRGSGKSTYIQYFSHATRFDKNLNCIKDEEFDCILLYWKPEIAYCQGLKPNWLGDAAIQFFNIHTALSLMAELSSLLDNISYHFPDLIENMNASGYFWKAISKVTKTDIATVNQLSDWLTDYEYEISTRLNPLDTENLLSFEPKSLLRYLIENLRKDYPRFRKTVFKVFVDEFELLNEEQQKIINTFRKESNKLLNWNVAYKLNAKPSIETTTNQWLQAPDDYQEENLDMFIESNYRIFAAEIFLLTLQNAGLTCGMNEITPHFLGNRENIRLRKQKKYQANVIAIVESILPQPSVKELSTIAFKTNSVQNKLTSLFKQLNISKVAKEVILKDTSLAVTLIGISRQVSFDPQLIERYGLNKTSAEELKKIKEKVSTFEFNTLLSLNLQHAALQIPVYAGFERFVTMTTPNIRHFKDLCLSALKKSDDVESDIDYSSIHDIKPISFEGMHLGAINSSSALVKEVISYPPHGKKLAQLVNRFGELFKISQKSSYQTEPERVIFSFEYDFSGADKELEEFLNSALSWRVIVDDDARRIKDERQTTSREFRLNPIYSPKFGISHRKKRGITISLDLFKTLVTGSSDDFDKVKKQFQSKWKADEEGIQGVLL
ncbi:conserved hypothetical protein [Alteromonas macleodii]